MAAGGELIEHDVLARDVRAILVRRLFDVVERPRYEGMIRDAPPVKARLREGRGVGFGRLGRGLGTPSSRDRRRQCSHVL